MLAGHIAEPIIVGHSGFFGRDPDQRSLRDVWRSAMSLCGAGLAIGMQATVRSAPALLIAGGLQDRAARAVDVDAMVARFEDHYSDARAEDGDWRWLGAADAKLLRTSFAMPLAMDVKVARLGSGNGRHLWILLGFPAGETGVFDADRASAAARVMALCLLGSEEPVAPPTHLRLFEAVLDEFAPSLIVTDAHSQVLWANAPGEAMLKRREPFSRGSDRRLASGLGHTTAQLRAAVAKVTGPRQGNAAVEDQSLALEDEDGRACLVTIRRLDMTVDGEANALLIVPRLDMIAMARRLEGRFGIIPSEARFIAAILKSGSALAGADSLGLSPSTARTYLKRIYSKLGIGNQLELASLMAGMTPPVSVERGAMLTAV